jgi:hypothetical protein
LEMRYKRVPSRSTTNLQQQQQERALTSSWECD